MKSIVRRLLNMNPNAKSDSDPDQRTLARLRDKVIRYLLRRLSSRDSQDVYDLWQEVLIRLLRRDNLEDIEEPLAYLYGVAAKVLAAHYTKRAKGARFVSGEDVAEIWENTPSESLADRLEDWISIQQQIATALDDLPPMQAAVLVLHERDGLSYAEVAEELGLTFNTVHKYVTQAKLKIRMHHDRK